MTREEIEEKFPRQYSGKRFEYRMFNGGEWQVYGLGLLSVAICLNKELAELICDTLNEKYP